MNPSSGRTRSADTARSVAGARSDRGSVADDEMALLAVSGAHDGITVIDSDRTYVFANPAAWPWWEGAPTS